MSDIQWYGKNRYVKPESLIVDTLAGICTMARGDEIPWVSGSSYHG
jgi:hypothetical protein